MNATSIQSQNLSDSEKNAIKILSTTDMLLVTKIPDKNENDRFGDVIPGINVYKKLCKKDICFLLEEEEDENGFTFTNSYCLTELGQTIAEEIRG